MRINLGYAGWPPIASHLFCFFLGLVLISHFRQPKEMKLDLNAGELLFMPDRSLGRRLRAVPINRQLILVAKEGDKGWCKINQGFIVVKRSNDTGGLYLKMLHADLSSGLLTRLGRGLELASKESHKNLVNCRTKPNVHYE